MIDNGYNIHEHDDPRTWDNSLVPDCEKVLEQSEEFFGNDEKLPVLEYIGEFKNLIDSCGQVSYFWNMRDFVKHGTVNKAKIVASAYNHDVHYYDEQLANWRIKARRSYSILNLHAVKFGYSVPEETTFLNDLTLSGDRRKAYKDYLGTCLKNYTTLSPQDLERKFQRRLKKRFKK
jgi:hypothetical protein